MRKVLFYRMMLIIVCIAIFILCFYQLNQTYDPLARYPYVNDENRDLILEYLDDEDIEYIISNQIRPEEFMDFIDEPGFEIRYCRLYKAAKDVQEESDDYIVNFVNRYRANFSLSNLEELLTYYSYASLTAFYENVQTNGELSLVTNPSYPYVILDEKHTVYDYVPSDLVNVGSVQLKNECASAYQEMEEAYKSVFGNDKSLGLIKGYTSYENLFLEYSTYQNMNINRVASLFMPAGHNEFQLGYTIALQGYEQWVQDLLTTDNQQEKSTDEVFSNLEPEVQAKIQWIEENASRYGFIIRYPRDKEDQTHAMFNPFVLRYVGVETAEKMQSQGKVMEEMQFGEEIE